MEEVKKSSNTIYIVTICILLCIICLGVGYYIGINKNNDVKDVDTKEETKKEEKQEEKTEENETIKYEFDASKVKNKVEGGEFPYTYSLATTNAAQRPDNFVKVSDGYKVSIDDQNITVKGEFKEVITCTIFIGGPGIDSTVDLFFKEDGTMGIVYFNENYKLEYKELSYKNIVKYYLVELDSDRPVSAGGATVVIQTKDGSLYDIYNDVVTY